MKKPVLKSGKLKEKCPYCDNPIVKGCFKMGLQSCDSCVLSGPTREQCLEALKIIKKLK